MKTTNRLFVTLITLLGVLSLQGQNPNEPWPPNEPMQGWGFTPASIVDGNGASTTNMLVKQSVVDNILPDPNETAADFAPEAGAPAGGQPQVEINVGAGWFTVFGYDGNTSTIGIPAKYKCNNRWTLKADIPLNYTKVKNVVIWKTDPLTGFPVFTQSDVDIWGAGLVFSGAYGIFVKEDNVPYRWQLTPSLGLNVREADTLDAGSWMYSGGISSSYNYKLTDWLIVNLGNSFTATWNRRLSADYAPIAHPLQHVTVNGLQLIFPVNRFVFNAFVMDTRFLRRTALDNYQTYGVGGGYQISKNISLRLYFFTDQGTDYEAYSVTFGSAFKF